MLTAYSNNSTDIEGDEMKFRILMLGVAMSVAGTAAQANVFTVSQIHSEALTTLNTISTMALINWKVGDSADMKVELGGMPFGGTMHKEATKEEGTGIWLKSQLNLTIMNDEQEMLLDRNTGKVLKFIHNGKEEALPDEKITIVKTEAAQITVPAGTFKCMHIVAKSDQVPAIELWENTRDVSLDGALKEYMDQGQVKITMELTGLKRNLSFRA